MRTLKKYTAYVWTADDEGGIGICDASKFTPNTGYYPASGWRARPSEKIGEFSSVDELAELLFNGNSEYYGSIEEAVKEASQLMNDMLAKAEIDDY